MLMTTSVFRSGIRAFFHRRNPTWTMPGIPLRRSRSLLRWSRAVRFYERAAQQQVIEATIRAATDTKGMGGWIDRVPPNVFQTNVPLQEIWPQIAAKLEEAGIEPEQLQDIDIQDLISIWQPNLFHHGDQPVARVVRDGQSELYEFDKDLFAAISGMNFFQLPYFLEITFGGATRLVKLGATGLSLAFSGRNVINSTTPSHPSGQWHWMVWLR